MDKNSIKNWALSILFKSMAVILEFRLLFFYLVSIIYLEMIYRVGLGMGINKDFVFPALFALPAAGLLYLLTRIFKAKINKTVSISLLSLMVLLYNVQLIYFCVFKAPFSFYSMTGAGDVLQFWNVITDTLFKNLIPVLLSVIPVVILLIKRLKFTFEKVKTSAVFFAFFFSILSYAVSILCVNLTGDGNVSQYTIYYKTFSPQLSVSKLGLMTAMRLDVQRLIFGNDEVITEAFIVDTNETDKESSKERTGANDSTNEAALEGSTVAADTTTNNDVECTQQTSTQLASEATGSTKNANPSIDVNDNFNIMSIDFDALAANEKDATLLDMHKYFSKVEPTKKNKYTGIFKGYNLIFITAEGFSNYAIDKELTPTLYKMKNEGFVFNNFYNPVWGVSTSDGEYVACTGLMPKAGVWSFAKSGANFMPFAMGNQFKKLGYPTRAYHDHTYTYYKRNISHPNMGYDYKGVGNGLIIKKTWPSSDLEMINVTAPEYIGPQPFHTYYMSVSGHLQYNFYGNYIAHKNKQLVSGLSYSEPSKAYIAANLEFEFAMKALMDKLEAAGIAEKTVIAISPDHYPYGLPRECINELAGHKVDDNFELYKSALIIYVKGMQPVIVDKPCCSLDIIPTLSNLFGLEFDSRLLMGRDILSDTPPLVTFSNMSWLTDRARFNSEDNKVEFMDGTDSDKAYIKSINKTVAERYKYSAKILDMDYYKKVVPKP